uniref:Uncharacterized protein n=1 Tax=Acrobeloides nanus TaxID=290746 RepID=A0A914E542_9BILA
MDILSLEKTCDSFRQICLKSRQKLPKIPIQFANCQYGKWFDVLKKHPCCKREKTSVEVEYSLSEPIFNQKRYFSQKHPSQVPFDFIVRECNFEFLTVDIELLNGDFRNLMHFDKLKVNSMILNFSHPKLHPRTMDRYLPGICADLNANKHIQSVDFIFCQNPENEPYKEKIKNLMNNKKTIKIYLATSVL